MRLALITTMMMSLTVFSNAAYADMKVVTTIKPIHSIVAAISDGVFTPSLLIDGNASPHDFSLRPSQAKELQEADIIFWVGHDLETFLPKTLENIKAQSAEFMDAEGLTILPLRELETFGESGDHDHDHEHKHGHGHDDDASDAHIWLDPENAKVMAKFVSETLSKSDPANTAIYAGNYIKFENRISTLIMAQQTKLDPVKDQKFITFHDGYQYFERRFGLTSSGTITINPEIAPSAGHIRTMREAIAQTKTACIFSEPQFSTSIVSVVAEGLSLKTAQLDPLGAALNEGPDLYFELINNMTQSFEQCLGDKS